ncbi:hypothetical protein BT96DRAFT_358860, partial [Gymnopus androsaceus JB14]
MIPHKASSSSMPSSIERDPSYYLPTKIFLVDGILFQIHVDFLARESEVFKDMMNLPVSPGGSAEGMSDENPIHLEGVSKDAFRQLLRVLYPSKAIGCPEVLSFSQWTLVLELADRYCMDSLRRHAISKMEHIQQVDPVDKLVLARRFNVSQWLLPSFTEILQALQFVGSSRCGFFGRGNCVALSGHPRSHALA